MSIAKPIRSLRVRPLVSADLSFNMPGILDHRNLSIARLGARVQAFDFRASLYDRLDERDPVEGTCQLGARAIRQELERVSFFAVRNESLAADLDQVAAQRHSAFMEFHKHSTTLYQLLSASFPAKLRTLKELQVLSTREFEALESSYMRRFNVTSPQDPAQDPQGVSEPRSTSTSLGKIVTDTRSNGVGLQQQGYVVQIRDDDDDLEASHSISPIDSKPTRWDGANFVTSWGDPNDPQYLTQRTTTDYTHLSDLHRQEVWMQNEESRHLLLENRSRHERRLVDLCDETIAEEVFNLRLPHLRSIWANELLRLDREVRKVQLNFAHTFLVSPIDGIVTAIYKDRGESVQPGEPVLRVENADKVLLVGFVQHRGPLRVDPPMSVVIQTADLYEAGVPLRIDGRLVALRGHDSGSDEWDVVIECDNSAHRLPINFHFDRDVTQVTFF